MADAPLPVCLPAKVRGIVVKKERGKPDKCNEHAPASQLLVRGLHYPHFQTLPKVHHFLSFQLVMMETGLIVRSVLSSSSGLHCLPLSPTRHLGICEVLMVQHL